MDASGIINALTQAGGYAALCVLLVLQLRDENKAHRDEVNELGDVVRENTAAITALLEHLRGGAAA